MNLQHDLGPLNWVKGEIDLSLDRARRALAGDTPRFDFLLEHLHQARGALEIVGLDGLTRFLSGIDALARHLADRQAPVSRSIIALLDRSLRTASDFLERVANGAPNRTLDLLPLYQSLREAAGLPPAAEDELFYPDLGLRGPRGRRSNPPREGEALAQAIRVWRTCFERGLLQWLKSPHSLDGLRTMREAVDGIEQGCSQPGTRDFWWIAGGLFDALAQGDLPGTDPGVRRLCTRMEQQIRRLGKSGEVPDPDLTRAILFKLAAIRAGSERVEAIRHTYRLAELLPAPAADSPEPPPAAPSAADAALAEAMEAWSRFSNGDAIGLPAFERQADALQAQPGAFPRACQGLLKGVAEIAHWLRRDPLRQTPALALEMAAALLALEEALTVAGEDEQVLAAQAETLAARLATLRAGQPLPPPERPLLGNAEPRLRARRLLQPVVREITASLARVEICLDAFFRNPAQSQDLPGLALPLKQVEGALTLLGEEEAAALVRDCATRIKAFSAEPADDDLFKAVADRLSALTVFVDSLEHGRADLSLLLGDAEGDDESPAAAPPPDLGNTMAALAASMDEVLSGEAAVAVAPEPEPPRPAAAPDPMITVFARELRALLPTLVQAAQDLAARPDDPQPLQQYARGLHTIKGAARMVGLSQLGETVQQVEDAALHAQGLAQAASPALQGLAAETHALLFRWADLLEAGSPEGPDDTQLKRLAEAVRGEQRPPAPEEAPTSANPPPPASESAPSTEPLLLTRAMPAAEGNAVASIPTAVLRSYLTEARQHVAVLRRELARLQVNPALLPPMPAIHAAHTLAGVSGTLGLSPIRNLARALEEALLRLTQAGSPPSAEESSLLNQAASAVESMVAAVAEGHAPLAEGELALALGEIAASPALTQSAASTGLLLAEPPPLPPGVGADRRRHRPQDDIDPTLVPVFLEEADELMVRIGNALRNWRAEPGLDRDAKTLARLLHTLKGSARMAGAMALGELTHRMETRVEAGWANSPPGDAFFDELEASFDRGQQLLDQLHHATPTGRAEPLPVVENDSAPGRATLRVRSDLMDRFVTDTGEISIARASIESEVKLLRQASLDLTDNVMRLRQQLREMEIQAESQLQSRLQQMEAEQAEFDPLEKDRYTRLQELTRQLAESVNDVTTTQQSILRGLDRAESALSRQGRLSRELQQALMSVRLVPFASLAERLHRVVRQAAKSTGHGSNLEIRGGGIELDRSVLERLTGPLEHLLRNAVSHGIEPAGQRLSLSKPELGQLVLTVSQEGNEIWVELTDDGAGLDFPRVRARAEEQGLLAPGEQASEARLIETLFHPGFSTAERVSEIAGRGVGLDAARAELAALGGRIELSTRPGAGTRCLVVLPLTTAVTPALLVQAGPHTYAIPSAMIKQAQELRPLALEQVTRDGLLQWQGQDYPFHYLPRLLGDFASRPQGGWQNWVLLLANGSQRIALLVDGLRGNQEIIVKHAGPQLARLPGITGATVQADGQILLILNPVTLATRAPRLTPRGQLAAAPATSERPSVMVVDDSLTVRKVTGRLLEREGYRVLTAKDGVEALERLEQELPDVMLVDIEMPRMDGFELTRRVRADARFARVPIVMITSRIADKHRQHGLDLGINHYLGKPYHDQELLQLIRGYIRAASAARAG